MSDPQPSTDPITSPWLRSSGEMAERTRAFDWSKTPVGPVSAWPQSLKTAVRIMLDSRYPMFIWWGAGLTKFYNDGYVSMLGKRHPDALGRSAAEVWSDVWPVVGPQTDVVLKQGLSTWNEELLLVMERNGFTEEAYFTFSYSPAPNDDGGVGGLFCAVTEDTTRVLSRRRLRTLRALAEHVAEAKTVEEACEIAAATLAENSQDLPFALLYLIDSSGKQANLAGLTGLAPHSPFSPDAVALEDEAAPWPFREVAQTLKGVEVSGLSEKLGPIPGGAWPESPDRAVVLPLTKPGQTRLAGFLVAGVSPRLALTDDYRGFLDLLAAGVTTAVTNARAHEEERHRAEALAVLDRAKTDFFSNVSHEFRTPLTLMLGPLEDLLRQPAGSIPAPEREQIDVAHRNSVRLLKLVNTLLDFSRIEAGRIQASYEPVDLPAFTAGVVSAFGSAIEGAGLRLVVRTPEFPEHVHVDREMWEKIVLNLLSNAFKFTFEGEIEVRLEAVGRQARLTVRDTGVGIPPDELPRVFERFYRAKESRGRTHEGTGIGLALVQELVQLHGGTVRAESTVDQGSRFIVSIPLGKEHLPADRISAPRTMESTALHGEAYVEEALRWLPERDGAPQPSPAAAPIPNGRILWAEDNADMRDYVSRVLAEAGWIVRAVADGQAALQAARADPPDLVLSDIMMPRLDGFGLLRELRADPATAHVPVILLSARTGEEARIRGAQACADDYLVKPFSVRELLARVESHMKLARLRREAQEALRAADRRKDEFLATLSHELRNPLAPICSALQVLKAHERGSENLVQQQAREIIERQVNNLTNLVGDLLEVSRVTSGLIRLNRQRVDFNHLIRHAVDTVAPLVQQHGHALSVTLCDEPAWVNVDVTRIEEVLVNLLSNAAKYTPDVGKIEVHCEQPPGGTHVRVRVRDTGMGIDAHFLPRIFDLFAQADRSLSRSAGGLGIGLSVASRLVKLHDGTLEAHSPPKDSSVGSEFIVQLPRVPSSAEGAGLASDSDGRVHPERAGLRVLVVDDNLDQVMMIATLLRQLGYSVQVAYTGPDGLKIAHQWRPDVVLMDIGLPGLDGYEVARRIRSAPEPYLRKARLIACTGYGRENDIGRAREAGFDAHLVKPVDIHDLERLLASSAHAPLRRETTV